MPQRFVLAAVVLLCGVTANAGVITDIEPFTGEYSEGFENIDAWGFVSSIEVFGGLGEVTSNVGCTSCMHVAHFWESGEGDTVAARTGQKFFGSIRGGIQWLFDTPAARFGGYFSRLDVSPSKEGALAEFYDGDDVLIGSDVITAPFGGQWTWNGWNFDAPVARIAITGFGPEDQTQATGNVMHDDMEYTPVPEPGTVLLLTFGAAVLMRRQRSWRSVQGKLYSCGVGGGTGAGGRCRGHSGL